MTTPKKHVLVVGDIAVDEYVVVTPTKISAEAPVLVCKQESIDRRSGCAANVAANLEAMGCDTTLIGIVGNDDYGHEIRSHFNFVGYSMMQHPTTVKRRFIARGSGHQLLRVDIEQVRNIEETITERSMIDSIETALRHDTHCIVISDYAKGVITPKIVETVMDKAQFRGIPVIVDPKRRFHEDYRRASMITPNVNEMSSHLHTCPVVLLTQGEHGMALMFDGQMHEEIRAIHEHGIVDVTGAGDTVVAAVAAHTAHHGSGTFEGQYGKAWALAAARVAAHAAGVVVQKLGTTTASHAEITESMGISPW